MPRGPANGPSALPRKLHVHLALGLSRAEDLVGAAGSGDLTRGPPTPLPLPFSPSPPPSCHPDEQQAAQRQQAWWLSAWVLHRPPEHKTAVASSLVSLKP